MVFIEVLSEMRSPEVICEMKSPEGGSKLPYCCKHCSYCSISRSNSSTADSPTRSYTDLMSVNSGGAPLRRPFLNSSSPTVDNSSGELSTQTHTSCMTVKHTHSWDNDTTEHWWTYGSARYVLRPYYWAQGCSARQPIEQQQTNLT